MKKDLVRKLRELDSALTDCAASSIIVFLFFLGLGFAVYFFGPPAGIYWLVGATIGTVLFFKTKEKPIDPFWVSRGLAWHIVSYSDKEFSKQATNYVRKASLKYNPWPLVALSYLIVIVMMVLSPNSVPLDNLLVAVLGLAYLGPVLLSHDAARLLMARNPRKISEFFGVPEKKWKLDLVPVKRPFSIFMISILFYGVGAFLIILTVLLMLGGYIRIPIIPAGLYSGINIIHLIGLSLLAGFGLATGHYLRKMRKEGAIVAIILCFFPLFIGVMAFVAAPLANQGWIPPYHTVWVFGVPIALIYILRRNWRKFRG